MVIAPVVTDDAILLVAVQGDQIAKIGAELKVQGVAAAHIDLPDVDGGLGLVEPPVEAEGHAIRIFAVENDDRVLGRQAGDAVESVGVDVFIVDQINCQMGNSFLFAALGSAAQFSPVA